MCTITNSKDNDMLDVMHRRKKHRIDSPFISRILSRRNNKMENKMIVFAIAMAILSPISIGMVPASENAYDGNMKPFVDNQGSSISTNNNP